MEYVYKVECSCGEKTISGGVGSTVTGADIWIVVRMA